MEIWDEKLVEYGNIISNYRREFINKIIEKINIIHKKITNDNEKIDIIYTSCCENKKNYMDLLTQRRKLDIIKGYTTKGIHRDDFEVYINDKELSIYGSQGQNRTAVLSLKLSELQVIHDEIEEEPILLLDDFMSELDIKRRRNFLNNINNTQVIITCAEKINFINENKIPCPNCGKTNFTDIRKFNLMFKTFQGVTEDSTSQIYLRPET